MNGQPWEATKLRRAGIQKLSVRVLSELNKCACSPTAAYGATTKTGYFQLAEIAGVHYTARRGKGAAWVDLCDWGRPGVGPQYWPATPAACGHAVLAVAAPSCLQAFRGARLILQSLSTQRAHNQLNKHPFTAKKQWSPEESAEQERAGCGSMLCITFSL